MRSEAVTGLPINPAIDAPSVPRDVRLRLLDLMLLQRVAEERIMTLYRQGRIPGSVYTGRGQEAVAAAAGLALGPDDVVLPLNREQACHYARGVTVADVLRNFFGKGTSPTRGRDGNMHFGKPDKGVFPLVSMLGDLVPVAVGAALAFKRRGEARVALTFLGEGAFCVGDVHEGFNLAGVLQVPAVFVIQNNQYAYSTPTRQEMVNTDIAERVRGGWQIPSARVDGTDALATYETIRDAVERARAGEGPTLIESKTYRYRGHSKSDRNRYRSKEEIEDWISNRDPIMLFEADLKEFGIIDDKGIEAIREAVRAEIEEGIAFAKESPSPDTRELADFVYTEQA